MPSRSQHLKRYARQQAKVLVALCVLATPAHSAALMSLPVTWQGRQIAMVSINDQKGRLYVWSSDVWALLRPFIQPEDYTRLHTALTTIKTWPLEESRHGFLLSYNAPTVTLNLTVPSPPRRTTPPRNTTPVPPPSVATPAPALSPGNEVHHTTTDTPPDTTSRVSVRGRLLDALGNPLALYAGEIRPASQHNTSHRMVFTDRNGYFNVHGLLHGEYHMVLTNIAITIPFTVTGTPTGMVDIGALNATTLTTYTQRSPQRAAITFVPGSGVRP